MENENDSIKHIINFNSERGIVQAYACNTVKLLKKLIDRLKKNDNN